MADEPAENLAERPQKSGKPAMIVGVIMGMLLLQGAGVFIAVKMIGKGPAEAAGVELTPDDAQDKGDEHGEKTAEILITKLRCPHTGTGKHYVIEMTVYATVPDHLAGGGESGGGHGEDSTSGGGIQAEIESHIATIKDRMRTIVTSADPGTLFLARTGKPDYRLSTLKRQFKSVLEDVLGKGKIKEVLICDYMPMPID